MKYTQMEHEETVVFRLQESFSFSDITAFQEIMSYVSQKTPKTVTLDVSDLDYIDSSALGCLLTLRDVVQEKQVNIVIKGAQNQVKKALDISCFDELFDMRA